jgi:hypothetical protein
VIDGVVFVAKKSGIMGNYSMILYNTPIGYKGDYSEFIKNGIGVRNNIVTGIKDSFGVEYVYDCNKTINMKGAEFSRFRNTINRYNISYQSGNSCEIATVVEDWSKINKSKHQIKLYKTILKNINKLTITRTYVESQLIGFSVIEKLNSEYAIILQRLINPNIIDISEPNIIIHYNDCVQNKNKLLNMGGCLGIKNMEFAKKKLRPVKTIQINRIKPLIKLTKEQYKNI